jgi:phosphohistidine swiveling domain-containing protein/uncharacterized protein (DUF1778 family)
MSKKSKNKKNIVWEKITAREYGVQYSEMQIRSLTDEVKKYLPYTCYNQVIIPEENNECFYIIQDDWNKLIKALDEKFSSSTQLLNKFEKQFKEFGMNYLNTARRIANLDLKKLPNSKLEKLYKDYQRELLRYSVFVWAGFILNNFVAQKAKQIIEKYTKKYSEKEKAEIIEAIFNPVKKAAVLRLQKDIEKFKKKPSTKSSRQLYLKYKWFPCLDIHNNPWAEKEFIKYIKLFKVKKEKQYRPIEEIFQDLKIKKQDEIYLEMAQRFAYIMDARDDFRREGVFRARALFKEIAERMAVKIEDVSYLQEKEIIIFLEEGKSVPIKVIKERQKAFALYFNEKKDIICEQGAVVSKMREKFKIEPKKETTNAIKGVVASSGNAKGKAVIVKGVKDLKKVKNGNIIVAITTHPDFMPAMEKASAFITDEGGLSCHAAITSREMNKPCIVGTKIATKVLKDGDLVEVDAEKGVVKILKKK